MSFEIEHLLEGEPLGDDDVVEDTSEHDVAETEEEEFERETGGSLRTKLVEALARVKELESDNESKTEAITNREMDDAFAANGLRRDEGLGKAIALGYDGPADADALAEHLAAEYGYTWAGEPHPLADQIATAQAKLDSVSETAGSVPVETPWSQELAKAEAARDNEQTMAMKGQEVAGWFRS